MKTRSGNTRALFVGALVCIVTYFGLLALARTAKADHLAALGVGIVLGLVCAAITKALATPHRLPRTPSDTGYGMGDETPYICFDGTPVGARNSD